MAPAGDVNGDGNDDLIIGEPLGFGANYAGVGGRVYLILGGPDFVSRDMNTFTTGGNGVVFLGPFDQMQAGFSVLGTGDLNNDGFDDIAVGMPIYKNVDPYRTTGQRVFVFYGAAVLPTTDVVLILPFSSMGMNGFTAYNPSPFQRFGNQLSKAGDINGDGFPDILVSGDSVVYILFGGIIPLLSNVDVTASPFVWKFAFVTPVAGPAPLVSPSSLGNVISGGQDFSGDGVPDIMLGVIGQYTPTFLYVLKGPFDVVPTVSPTVVPTFSPTATPSTAPPTLIPTAAPTFVCVQWTLGEVGQTCAATCAGSSPARTCSDSYFEDITTADAFASMTSSAVDARSGVALSPAFCSGGTSASQQQDGARSVAYVLHSETGDTVRTYCSYATGVSDSLPACNATSLGFFSRRFCPCVHEACDVVPWFLGYSGESCSATCGHVGRECDAELVSSISDRFAFDTMVGVALAVEGSTAVGSAEEFCATTNAPQFEEQYPAVVKVNVPGNLNYTYCSHAVTPVAPSSGDCDAAITSVPAQRFCPCKYGRKLTEMKGVEDDAPPAKSTQSRSSLTSKIIAALPYLRGANV